VGTNLNQNKAVLKLDWCSHAAAVFAVMHWHYSKTMPIGKLVKIGVWEDGRFIGAVLFARGNSPTLGASYNLSQTEVCELVRVALTEHGAPVSRIVSISIKLLKKQSPGLRLIVSFADPAQGHNGAIYQAGNWVYTGKSLSSWQWFYEGEWKHNREITSGAFGRGGAIANYTKLPKRLSPGKHRYLYPLDDEMRQKIGKLAKPYPKRITRGQGEIDSAAQSNAQTEGARPICPLLVGEQ
jgi:hypothetical protein